MLRGGGFRVLFANHDGRFQVMNFLDSEDYNLSFSEGLLDNLIFLNRKISVEEAINCPGCHEGVIGGEIYSPISEIDSWKEKVLDDLVTSVFSPRRVSVKEALDLELGNNYFLANYRGFYEDEDRGPYDLDSEVHTHRSYLENQILDEIDEHLSGG